MPRWLLKHSLIGIEYVDGLRANLAVTDPDISAAAGYVAGGRDISPKARRTLTTAMKLAPRNGVRYKMRCRPYLRECEVG